MIKPEQEFMHHWQRVSLLAIIYFFVSRGLGIIKELAMNAAPAFAAILIAVEDKTFWFTVAGLGFLGIIIVDVVVLYLTYRYRIEDDQVVVRQGLFTKEVLNLKYARIQNINNAVPWYFKPFDLVRCTLDSAGSSAKEINIPGISAVRSAAIAGIIQNYQRNNVTPSEKDIMQESTEAAPNENVLRLSNKEVTKYGFTNSMIFVFAGAFFPVAEKFIETTGIDITNYISELATLLPLPSLVAKILLIIISVTIFAFLLLSITALGAFVKYYNYELFDEGNKLKRIAGLLERQTIFLNKNKVQGISIKQNVFARLLGRVTVYFQQTSADGKSIGKKQAFIIPMLESGTWQNQLKMIYPELVEIELKFTSIERQYLSKIILYGCLLPISIVVIPLTFFTTYYFLLLYLLGLPIIGFSYLRYRRYGYCVLDNHLLIREGLIGTNYHILERFKTQHLSEATSPSQRRLGLGSLNIQMAYSALKLPYIKQSELRQIINQGLMLTESTQKSWM